MSTNIEVKKHFSDKNNYKYDTNTIKIFGFWIYLMSDLILFACLFATYAVMLNSTIMSSKYNTIFNLNFILVETLLLLFSSITYGFAMLAMHDKKINLIKSWLIVTFLFGFIFIFMEIYEFNELFSKGYTYYSNSFLSAFFTLVGTHGIHVSFGLAWIIIMIIHISHNGLTQINQTRLNCLSLFWHFLDVIWICVFTVVYLLGRLV
ncbi:MAG: cytochrome o ubiquinol oxidase subunit III [Arsenophonus sp.]